MSGCTTHGDGATATTTQRAAATSVARIVAECIVVLEWWRLDYNISKNLYMYLILFETIAQIIFQ